MTTSSEVTLTRYIDGNNVTSETVSSFEDLTRIISSFSEYPCSGLTIDHPNGRSLILGGGKGRFLVTIIGTDYGPYDLLMEPMIDSMTELLVSGVRTTTPEKYQVDVRHAIAAVDYFRTNGECNPLLKWDG